MKHALFFLLVFTGLIGYAQKRMTKKISADNIEVINFKFNQASKVKLTTHSQPYITINAYVAGENNEHIVLTNRKYKNALFISTDFQPNFKDANDKLSAHKVISIELTVLVPNNKRVYLKSDLANVASQGAYKKLTLELLGGGCTITNFSGNTLVNTTDGDISIHTNFATIDAKTAHGNVTLEKLVAGTNVFVLNSVNGNITVSKSEE